MKSLHIIPDLEQQGFREGQYGVVEHEGEIAIGGLANGTTSGKPVVLIAIEDPGGSGALVVSQTTLALFLTAADALKAKYGDPRT